jgi:hypothetical protein
MKFKHSQELVLQLPGESVGDYDALIELESILAKGFEQLGEIDGHDMGMGEMNIFIRTDNPRLAFERAMILLGTKDFMSAMKAAYRNVGQDNFTILHPAELRNFNIS